MFKLKRKQKKVVRLLKNIKMTDKERVVLRSQILQFMESHPLGTRLSPYVKRSTFSMYHFTLTNAIRLVAIILVSTMAVGSTISSVANKSLPGQVLYKVKIANEEIELALTFSQIKKIDVQKGRIENRLDEVQTLLKESKLNKENEEEVSKQLGNHIDDIVKTMNNLNNDQKIETTMQIISDLAPTLSAHQEVINIINEKTGNSTDILTSEVMKGIEKINQQEENAISLSSTENIKSEILSKDVEEQLKISEDKLILLNKIIYSEDPFVILNNMTIDHIEKIEEKLNSAYNSYELENFEEALNLAKEAERMADVIIKTEKLEDDFKLNTISKNTDEYNMAEIDDLTKSLNEIDVQEGDSIKEKTNEELNQTTTDTSETKTSEELEDLKIVDIVETPDNLIQ